MFTLKEAWAISAWPLVQTQNLWLFAKKKDTPLARALTMTSYLPIIVATTAVWAALWSLGFALIWRVLSSL